MFLSRRYILFIYHLITIDKLLFKRNSVSSNAQRVLIFRRLQVVRCLVILSSSYSIIIFSLSFPFLFRQSTRILALFTEPLNGIQLILYSCIVTNIASNINIFFFLCCLFKLYLILLRSLSLTIINGQKWRIILTHLKEGCGGLRGAGVTQLIFFFLFIILRYVWPSHESLYLFSSHLVRFENTTFTLFYLITFFFLISLLNRRSKTFSL